MFRGYKLKFQFNAAHSNLEMTENDTNVHFHTFTLVLYLNDLNQEIDYFYDIEKYVNEWLEPYRNKNLFETELFQGRSTTLESIGNAFYDLWYKKLLNMNLDLIRLDIYENPIRIYSVSNRILDATVNEIGALPYAFYDNVEMSQLLNADENHESISDKERNETIQPADTQPETGIQEVADIPVLSVTESKECETAEQDTDAKSDESVALQSKAQYRGLPGVVLSVAAIGLLCVIGIVIARILGKWGNYPAGSDTYCHLYRADLILQNIRLNNWFPLYDASWYNGVEIMRYWGPLPLYVLAFFEYLCGDIFAGYLAFVGFLFVLGAVGFYLMGYRLNRPLMGFFVGTMWFFLPENMKVLFYDGNIPRALINALLPYMILFIYGFLKKKKTTNAAALMILFALITFCHIGTTIMLMAVLLIYLLIYAKVNHSGREAVEIFICAVIGMLLSGIWMIPSFHGSGAGGSSNQIMEGFFQNAFLSLNPYPAWNGQTLFYFGLSIFIICIAGFFFGTKESIPGFSVGLIIFFLTTESAYDILSRLPFSSYLWMMRFVSMSLSFVMAALLLWKGLKKKFVVVMCVLLFVDCIPVARYLYTGIENTQSVYEKNDDYAQSVLFTDAKEITNQRMAVFDMSGFGSFVPYYVAGVDKKVDYLFGAGWEGARTAANIVKLNASVENGNYKYTFDRSIELGTDTLVFLIDKLRGGKNDIEELKEAGEQLGYEPVAENDKTIVFHKDTPQTFGVITEYENIAIGNAAKELAMLYPNFEEGFSDNLSDYTYDDLKKYHKIYLSDFEYSSRSEAEKLLNKLAEDGVKIFIDMNKVPVDAKTNRQEIFGVSVQPITFERRFADINYQEEVYKTSGFPDTYKSWKANYLIGLDNVTGYSSMNGKELALCGTNGNDNIVFLGYNFVYYAEIANDSTALKLLSAILDEEIGTCPKRELVPLQITHGINKIIIESEYDHVNTTLANIKDIFESKQKYTTVNNLIEVNSGNTTIWMHYPYKKNGTFVTFCGIILFAIYILYLWRRELLTVKTEME